MKKIKNKIILKNKIKAENQKKPLEKTIENLTLAGLDLVIVDIYDELTEDGSDHSILGEA